MSKKISRLEVDCNMTKRIEDCMLKGPDDLKEGECYFEISFWDTQCEIPCIETWIYVGKNLLTGGETLDDLWYFQDPESFLKHGSFVHLSADTEHDVITAEADAVRGFYNFEGLQEALATLKPKIINKVGG